MTKDEAQKVANICVSVYDHCGVCVAGMLSQLQEQFPEFRWELISPATWDEDARVLVELPENE